MKEQFILEQLKNGDEHAFRYVYDKHYALLCRYACQLLRDASLAEEIVDDAIFYLWEHRADIEIENSVRAYLMRAVHNHCLNELNALKRQNELPLSSYLSEKNLEFLESVFVENKHPLGLLLEQELESKLLKSIEALPAECRTVFKKNRFEQKKYEDIAAELHISINTVKYHIKNALSLLRKSMEPYLKLLLILFFALQ